MKIKKPYLLHDWLHDVDFTMCKLKKRPSILKYQSITASKLATGMQGYIMTKNIGIIQCFYALTFAVTRGSCLNPRPLGRGFKLLPRDTAIVNALK